MKAIELIEALKADGVTVKASGEYLELSPVEKITEELIQRLKKHKPEIISELRRESRRLKVLDILAANPDTQRAIVTDMNSDPKNVLVTIALRGMYSFEILVSKSKYDNFLFLQLIERGGVQ